MQKVWSRKAGFPVRSLCVVGVSPAPHHTQSEDGLQLPLLTLWAQGQPEGLLMSLTVENHTFGVGRCSKC